MVDAARLVGAPFFFASLFDPLVGWVFLVAGSLRDIGLLEVDTDLEATCGDHWVWFLFAISVEAWIRSGIMEAVSLIEQI